jgi:PadR family transcriptional regulator, regulatory protein PadR
MKVTNPNFQNGVPELLLLQLLAAREMYGYELVKEIQARTNGLLTFGEGCIYPILHYLEEKKLVKSQSREVEGRSRNYYRLTSGGQRRLGELTADWSRVTEGVGLILGVHHA